MNKLTSSQIAKEVKILRQYLDPVLNQQFKELLAEVENRLAGKKEIQTREETGKSKLQQGKRLTKKDIYNKYFYK